MINFIKLKLKKTSRRRQEALDTMPKAQSRKEKINWISTKLKTCSSEDMVKRIKRKWEEIFVNYISEQGLHPEYINNYENSVRRKQKTHFQKISKRFE